MNFVSNNVITTAIGSTSPDNAPSENAFNLLVPLLFHGIEVIAPSGKF